MAERQRQVVYSASQPDAAMLGQIWVDTSVSPPAIKTCSVESPRTFALLSTSIDTAASYTWTGPHRFTGSDPTYTIAQAVALSSSNRAGMAAVNLSTTGTGNSAEFRFYGWDGASTSSVGQIASGDSLHSTQPNSVWVNASRATGKVLLQTVSTTRLSIDSAGLVAIAAPSSGTALTINSASAVSSATPSALIASSTAVAAVLSIAGNAGAAGTSSFNIHHNASNVAQLIQYSNAAMEFYTNGTLRQTIAATGNVTIAAPSSGTTLTVNGVSAGPGINIAAQAATAIKFLTLTGTTTAHGYIEGSSTGAAFRLGMESSAGGAVITSAPAYSTFLSTFNTTSLVLGTNSTAVLTIASGGATTLAGSFSGTSSILSTSPSAGVGYATGAGGTVTQITSRTTGVTLNKICGAITLVSAAGSATWATFTVTNSTVAATDVIDICQKSGSNLYSAIVTAVAAGSFKVSISAVSGTATESPVFNFNVTKAVTA